MKPCKFCDVSAEAGFDIIWEAGSLTADDRFAAFSDHKPASEHHIQVIPKRHIKSVRMLGKQDVELVRTMKSIGDKLLNDRDVSPSMRVMGFHIPPFNSVNHLHLHVQGLPYKGGRQVKYRISPGCNSYQKGFGWFIEADQAARVLEEGRRIGLFPC
ncbi:HIT-like protein [Mycena sp. CBHHK59/15]|nr:HIT-like protein [Mycena sp. CBHHK59/15]